MCYVCILPTLTHCPASHEKITTTSSLATNARCSTYRSCCTNSESYQYHVETVAKFHMRIINKLHII